MKKPPALSLRQALDALRRRGTVLTKLHKAGGGIEYFVVPGGQVSEATVKTLLERNDVQPYDSGLLDGFPQSWRLGDWRAS